MVIKFYYHPNSPPSKAIWMILEHMGIEYEPHLVDLLTGEHLKPEFLDINPLAQVPAIVDGDFKLWESRAIAAWLITKYGADCKQLYPSDLKRKAYVDMVLYSDASIYEGKIQPYLNFNGVLQKGEGIAVDKLDDLKAGIKMYDYFLSQHKFVAGDNITIADFICLNSLWILNYAGFDDWKEYPHLQKWFENEMKVLPSFKKCIEDEHPKDAFRAYYIQKLEELKKKKEEEMQKPVEENLSEE